MTLSVIFYPYHFVRAILSIPFWPMPFCPYTILSIPFCPYHFVHTILSNAILSVYHFVHTILSVPFCPYHFVRYHFVLEPGPISATVSVFFASVIALGQHF